MRRYGILFRELIERELPLLRWSSIFRTLRIMELSGEIYSGYFFENIPGLQFISSGALRMLQDPLDTDAIYWLNAADPASLCGINIKELKQNFPSRLTSTWLVCHGAKIAMLVKKNGKAIVMHASPHSPVIQEYLKIYTALFSRNFNPEGHLFVESINGIAAANSEYAADFKNFGFKPYYKSLSITKNYR